MSNRRTQRLNSLLKEVLSDVIHQEVKNPNLPELVTVTHVEISKDLRHAKVFVSVIGEPAVRNKAIDVLQSASGFIAIQASKQIVIRFFPELRFVLDNSLDTQMHIETLINQIQSERKPREEDDE